MKDMMRRDSLPDGLDFPPFPSLQLSRFITSIIYVQNSYFVNILQNSLNTIYTPLIIQVLPFPHGTVRKFCVF
jgi:hypothetical protein